MGYPRFRRSRAHKFSRRTSGNIAIVNAAWQDIAVDLDIVLEAQVGDTIEVGVTGSWMGEALNGYLDVVTRVNGVQVSNISGVTESGTSEGVTGWYGLPSAWSPVGGSVMNTLVAGDISANGLVTLRLRGRTNAAGTKSIAATAAIPFQFWAKNLGPMDPN